MRLCLREIYLQPLSVSLAGKAAHCAETSHSAGRILLTKLRISILRFYQGKKQQRKSLNHFASLKRLVNSKAFGKCCSPSPQNFQVLGINSFTKHIMKTSWWICPKSFSLSVPKAALAWMLLNNYFCGECFF